MVHLSCFLLRRFFGALEVLIVKVVMVRAGANYSHNLTLCDEVMSMQ